MPRQYAEAPIDVLLAPRAILPSRATRGSFGYDLSLLCDTTVKCHETVAAACGLQLAEDLPHDAERGLAMMILPRSSLWKHGLIVVNAPGLVDADYAKPVFILLHSLAPPDAELRAYREAHPDQTPLTWHVQLSKGTRVAQAIFVECHLPALRPVPQANPARSRGGIGSTGI